VNTFNVDSYTAQNIQVQLNYYFQCLPGESIDLTRGGVQYHRSTQYSQLAFSQNDSSWTHKEIAGLTPLRDAAYRESSPADGVPNNGDGVADVFFFYTRGAGRRIVFDRNMPGKTMTTDGMLRPNGATLPDDVVDLTGIYSKPRNYNSVMFGEALRYYSPLSDPELVGTTDDGKAYTFAGWYLKNDGAPATAYYIPINDVTVGDPNRGLNRFLTDTMPSEDLVLFAKWVPDPYTLEFADDVGHPDNGGVIFYRERDLFELIGSATSGDAGTDYSRDTGGGAPNPNDYRVGTTTVGERTFLGWYYAIGTENAQQLDIGRTQVSGGISRIFAKWSEVEGDITVVYMNSDSKIKWNWGRELWPWNRWLSGSDTPNAGVTQPVYSSTDRVYAMQPPSRNADLYQTGDRVDEFVGWELGKFVAGTWVAYGTRDSLGNLISGLVLSPNDELVIADYTDAITVIDSGNYAEYQVKLNSNANLVSKPYEPGKYLFFRPIFASDTKYGIVYEVDGKAYVHYANKYEKGESVRIHDADSFNGAFRDYNGGVDLISDSNPSGKKFVNWQVKIALDSTVERYGFPGEVTYEPGKLRNLRAAINYGYVHDADAVNDWYSTADESLVYGSWLKYNDVGDAVRYGVPEGNYIVLQPVYSYTITFDLNTTDDTARLTVNGHDYNNSDDMYLKPVTEGFAFANPGTAHVNSGATSLKWYYDSACTIEWNFAWEHYNEVLAGSDLNGNGILESGDMTLYASWDNDFSFAVRPSKSEIAYANDDKSGKPIGTALEAKFFVYIKDGVLLSTSALGDTSGANFGLASAGQVPTVKFYTKSGINNPSPDKELSIGVTGASLRYIGTESRDLERTGTAILYKKYEYSFNVSISDIRNAIRDVTNNTDRVVAFLEVTAKKGGAIFLSSDTLGAGSLNDPAKSTICLYQKGIRLTT
jgi:hypothetical protein